MSESPAPIFVVGCPRSGNTLVGCILNKHPELAVFFEQSLFRALYSTWQEHVQNPSLTPRQAFLWALRDCNVEGRPINRLSVKWEEVRECLACAPATWGGLLDSYMRLLIRRAMPSATRWGDKTPHHVGHLREIHQTYPGAQFIYVYRDPRHTVASLSRSSFPHASDRPLVNAEVVRYYHSLFEREQEHVPRESIFELRYEELIDAPDRTLESLCSFLGIDYTTKLKEPASEEVRRAIGWEEYKGWGELTVPDSKELASRLDRSVEAYLSSLVRRMGYQEVQQTRPKDYLVGYSGGLSFRMLRSLLGTFWKMKRDRNGPFMLNRVPTKRDLASWTQNILNGRGLF